jgi:hypothetical protein
MPVRLLAAAVLLVVTLLHLGSAAAATVQLSGTVSNGAGTPVSAANVSVVDPGSGTIAAVGPTDANGHYQLSVQTGTYDVRIDPPPGSGYQPAVRPGEAITADKVLNFVLVPAGLSGVTLSGRVLDPSGLPMPNQTVQLQAVGSTGFPSTRTTDAAGAYTFSVSPGDYQMSINGSLGSPDLVPPSPTPSAYPGPGPIGGGTGSYNLGGINLSLTADRVLDVRPPLKRVAVHVQDPSIQPVAGARIAANSTGAPAPLDLGGGVTANFYSSSYFNGGPTDAGGNTVLWLLPSRPSQPPMPPSGYSFTATPPAGSTFGATTVAGVAVTADTSITINLASSITFSGRVIGPTGSGMPNQNLSLMPQGGSGFPLNARTDANGAYSFNVSPGQFQLSVNGSVGSPDLVPPTPTPGPIPGPGPGPGLTTGSYNLGGINLSLTQSTALDIRPPLKRVAVHVQSSGGAGVSGATLSVNSMGAPTPLDLGGGVSANFYSSSYFNGGPTDASGDTVLWLLPSTPAQPPMPPSGYSFSATPPLGSGFGSATVTNVAVTGDTSLSITLGVPVTLSGRVIGPTGAGMPNQNLSLMPQGGSGSPLNTRTDANGAYSFSVGSGQYQLGVNGSLGSPNLVPPSPTPSAYPGPGPIGGGGTGSYNLGGINVSLTQNTTLDIRPPLKRVALRVQDPAGNPVSGVTLSTSSTGAPTPLDLGGGVSANFYSSSYFNGGPTDASGNTVLWLLPSPPPQPFMPSSGYSFTAMPPSSSPLVSFTVRNVTVAGDVSLVLVLQFVHPSPTTTASFSPAPSGGSSPVPVTVTLQATAYPGYSVTSTYYRIGGAAQQLYTGPFTLSADGTYLLRYWSVDNQAVVETPKSATLTIGAGAAGTPTATPTPTFVPVSTTIPANSTATVTVTTSNQSLTLAIPPGAAQVNGQPVAVTVDVQPAAPPPPELSSSVGYGLKAVQINMTTTDGQKVTQLARPITIELAYSDAELASLGITPTDLKIYFTSDGFTWQALPTTVDTGRHVVVGLVDHLTTFALTGLPSGATATPSPQPTATPTPAATRTPIPSPTPTRTPAPIPAGGIFVIGDGDAAPGSPVTFWGSQWSSANRLSGGLAPSDFKGFAVGASPTCGGSWTTGPGNSANPSATLPSTMAVVVASAVTRQGSTISGDVRRVVVVQVDPGYGPNPGNPGTGKVIAVVCG